MGNPAENRENRWRWGVTNEQLDRLDRLCAEKIMGWTTVRGDYDHGYWRDEAGYFDKIARNRYQPTRNIAQAWELHQKVMRKTRDCEILIFNRQPDTYECRIKYSDQTFSSTEKTMQLAIVLACLKAKGVEI